MSDILYREAERSDAANITALMLQVWLHTYATDGLRTPISNYVLETFTENKWLTLFDSKCACFIVAECHQHLVGVAQVNPLALHPIDKVVCPELEKLYVQAHFYGKGIGSGLLDAVTHYLNNSGKKGMWLTVNTHNKRALRFYRHHHFENIGTTHFELDGELHPNHILYRR